MSALPGVTLKIIDGRIPDTGLVPRLLRTHGVEERVVLERRLLSREELAAAYTTARIAVVPFVLRGLRFPRDRSDGLRLTGRRPRSWRTA